MGFIFGQEKGWGPGIFTIIVVCFLFTSHLDLQSCHQRANELVGLSMELRHLQHRSEGASSEELLLWMRSQERGKVHPPLAPVSFYTNRYLCTCILLLAGLYLLTLVVQGWSHLEEPTCPIKVEPQWPGALPMPEPVLPVGTIGEGAPGHQPSTAKVSEEVQLVPTSTPQVSTLLLVAGTLPIHGTV